MKLLVMGGTAFVSRAMAEYFIEVGYEVSIFTRGNTPLMYAGVAHHFIGDRNIAEDFKQLEGHRFDYVLDINGYSQEHVKNLVDVLDISSLKRYVFCSTGGVYLPCPTSITEAHAKGDHPLIGSYGTDKLAAEQYLWDQYKDKGLRVSIFRPPYIYGPYNGIYREGYFFDQINKGGVIPLPGSDNKVTFIHTHDLVRFVESLLDNDKAVGQAYNINHPKAYSFKDLIDCFETVLHKKAKVLVVDPQAYDARDYFPYLDMAYVLSVDKLKDHGLFVPEIDLVQGLKDTYTWYKTRQGGPLKHRMNTREAMVEALLKQS